MSKQLKREIQELVGQLLTMCSSIPKSTSPDWDEYLDIYSLVQEIRQKQKDYVMPLPKRGEEQMTELVKWLQENEVDMKNVEIHEFEKEGYGLRATDVIRASDQFLSVPRKIMITTTTAELDPVLGPMIEQDHIMQVMPNVVLALHVLNERMKPDTTWKPYLDALPDTFTTPLYFTPEEVQLLKGTEAFGEALNQFKNIARQYAYFYKLFQGLAFTKAGEVFQSRIQRIKPNTSQLAMRNFCYDDYRWAVSVVMTRQNKIPNRDGHLNVLALIPLYDMCNHCNGQLTTDFSIEKDHSECFALDDYNKGDQVYIFYGARTNTEFLVHSGFVDPANHHNHISLRLGVSKNDRLCGAKAEVLARLSMLPNRVFILHGKVIDPVDEALLGFLRVFNLDEEGLRERLWGDNAAKLIQRLRNYACPISEENEKKVWSFLETRAQLMMKTYPTTMEEDEELLKKEDLTEHARLAILLRLGEKQIYQRTIDFCRVQKEKVKPDAEIKVNEQLALAEQGEDGQQEEQPAQEGEVGKLDIASGGEAAAAASAPELPSQGENGLQEEQQAAGDAENKEVLEVPPGGATEQAPEQDQAAAGDGGAASVPGEAQQQVEQPVNVDGATTQEDAAASPSEPVAVSCGDQPSANDQTASS